MSLEIYINDSREITVSNIKNVNGVPPTAVTSAKCEIVDQKNTVIHTENMTGDNTTQTCTIGPVAALVKGQYYTTRITIVADGATMSGECGPWKADYREICDGVF